MKKEYQKPCLICEDLHPEEMLCACDLKNPIYSDLEMCGYPIKAPGTNTTFVVFGENWTGSCNISNEVMQMCFHTSATAIFTS